MKTVKILSTRKLPDEASRRLRDQDIELVEQDFISISPDVSAETVERIKNIQPGTTIVFTSANAVEAVKDIFPAVACRIFCISGRTREAVESAFTGSHIAATAEYGTGLAEKIIAAGVDNVVFFCGSRRRDELPGMLAEKGITVEEHCVYQTVESPVKTGSDWQAVLFFSPSAVNSFFSANELQGQTVCFAVGSTTAGAIRQHTNNKIIEAAFPSAEELVAAVITYFN